MNIVVLRRLVKIIDKYAKIQKQKTFVSIVAFKNIDQSKLKVKYWRLLGKSLQKQKEKEIVKQKNVEAQ